MQTNDQLVTLLSRHIGKGNGIGVKDIARQIGANERHVRTMVSDLRDEGLAVCGTPRHGYYIAATPEELEETCPFCAAAPCTASASNPGCAASRCPICWGSFTCRLKGDQP